MAAVVKDETTSDEVSALVLEDCPIRMACHPSGRSLVLAMSKGGLSHVDVSVPEHGGAPMLTLASGANFRLAMQLESLPCQRPLWSTKAMLCYDDCQYPTESFECYKGFGIIPTIVTG